MRLDAAVRICNSGAAVVAALAVMTVPMGPSAGEAGEPQVEYLSDAAFWRIAWHTQGWGELGLDTCTHAPGVQALRLRIGEQEYEKGLGHHAPGEMVVELDGQYEAFEAEIGVQWQSGDVGSVVFQVLVDGEEQFDSGVMRERDAARPIRVPTKGAQELRLVVTDAGDGITCDCANWANARLVRDPDAPATAALDAFDAAPFARVVTSDPSRMDGCRASRIQEFLAEDVFPETQLHPGSDGSYVVPMAADGRGCIGLVWPEPRTVTKLAMHLKPGAAAPEPQDMQVQCWFGESLWQGNWRAVPMAAETQEGVRVWRADIRQSPELREGVRKVRWVFSASSGNVVVQQLSAFTRSRTDTVDLVVELGRVRQGKRGQIEVYNGQITKPRGQGSPLRLSWDLGRKLRLRVLYTKPQMLKADRTLLRFRLPGEGRGSPRAFAVAVEDVLANERVYLRDFGVSVARESAATSLAEHRGAIADHRTVLERVRERPDQTFAQALEHVHRPIQDNGPTMLSLACDNRKYVVEREGTIRFSAVPDLPDPLDYAPDGYPSAVQVRLGSGADDGVTRHLDGGWLPAPVVTVRDGGLVYRERAFVAPWGDEKVPALAWLHRRVVCVAELTVMNPQAQAARATVGLSCLANAEKGQRAQVVRRPQGVVAHRDGQVLALLDTRQAAPLELELTTDGVTLTGELPPQASARCVVFIPGWYTGTDEQGMDADSGLLFQRMQAYWEQVLADAMQVELPDELLTNVIRASQVHCLMAARNEERGERIAPWIASGAYGPLESEANSVISGMDLLGHPEFARRSLDYFIKRYNPAGFLTTGYTIMGTGWNLEALGEYWALTRDREWMERVAPQVAQACQWIVRQREKTKRLDPWGQKVPEYGLTPPGVTADWNLFSYRHYNHARYYGGLKVAASALADIGYAGADGLLADAEEFRQDIARAYRWTQARSPAFGLSDGTFTPASPSTVENSGTLRELFPGADWNRSWAGDVEIGVHHLIAAGVLDAHSREAEWILDQLEDYWMLESGMGDYPAEESHADWFNLGGFAKVQPYYARVAEAYALRDDVKPFVRAYLNAIPSLLNLENLSFWEHFHNGGAWNKTHETGGFLRQTRTMLVMERGAELWLAPFVPTEWLQDGMTVSVRNAPTRCGPVSYRITSSVDRGFIEADIEPPSRTPPEPLVIRLRHPEEQALKAVRVNGRPHAGFDAAAGTIRLKATTGPVTVRAEY